FHLDDAVLSPQSPAHGPLKEPRPPLPAMRRHEDVRFIDDDVLHGRSPVLPAYFLVAELESLGMKNLRQNLQRFHQSRSRPIEELIAVHDKDAAVSDRLQLTPIVAGSKSRHFTTCAFDVETARQGDNDFGIFFTDLFPRHPGRMPPSLSEEV